MKWIYILLILTLLMCGSGIVSAANTTTDMSKMVDMGEVKQAAVGFWADLNKDSGVGNLILGMGLATCVVILVFAALFGTGQSVLGKKGQDANATNEGRKTVTNSVLAAVGLVIALMVIGVFLAML